MDCRGIEKVLNTEFSYNFVELMKNRMYTSYHKYGPIRENYGNKLVSSIENLELRLKKYKETGNTEFLVDIANQAMIEFMFPQHKTPHFDSENHGTKIKGMTYRDIEGASGL